MAWSTLHNMTGHVRNPSSLLSFFNPVAFSSLFVIAAAGLACSGTDGGEIAGSGGQIAAAGSSNSVAGTSAGGASNAAGAPTNTGGSVSDAGGTAGAPTTAGGSGSVAGGGNVAGGGSVAGAASVAGSGNVAGSGSGGAGGSTGGTHWVGTWTASPYATASDGQPPIGLSNAVARQITHASLGGNQIRVQFSNIQGTKPLEIKAAHVALCKATPLVDGSIDTTTDKALAFSGMPNVTIPAGKEIWSDPLDFALPALGNLTITTAFGANVPTDTTLTSHNGARTTSYVVANSTDVSAANMTSSPNKNQHWWIISGVDVMAPADAKGIVAIGDSITDGRGVTVDANNRWTDDLAKRLHDNAATANVSLMNQGIGATVLVGATGTSAEARFARDVLGQSGVKYVIIFDGVNDIGGSSSTTTTYNSMKTVYDKLIKAGRDKGLLVYGATITPFNKPADTTQAANGYYSVDHETLRQQVNTYIRSGVFDGVIDFDAALTDGKTPPSMLPAAKSTDGLHPGPEGYQMMADKVDLTLFTK
ncbi:MAG TPA: SGNH/GDSL hydrolase family protein [Polyangiaceae bacterium]|nr:SGNH/GDSL hydrolase family protein [Polyangiaceae bacterium]